MQTPTRQVATGFEVETSNRVVREFVENHRFSSNRFLRVNISDENGRKLMWCDLTDPLQQRIRNCVLPGLRVNGRLYQFLAYSSSQLKECSMWMVDLDGTTLTVPAMRQKMGDFSKCLTPSKVAARMGQCLSTTFQGLRGHDAPPDVGAEVRHVQMADIICPRDNGIHSDGNGLIRRSAMTKLLQRIPSVRDGTELNHSIVQIRYGGAKGTLVAWGDDDFDKCLMSNGVATPADYDVAIRDSMVKFVARYERLEVCR
jgi:RNA-dependent RNA polymerase